MKSEHFFFSLPPTLIIPLLSNIGANLKIRLESEQEFYLLDDEGPLGMYSVILPEEEA